MMRFALGRILALAGILATLGPSQAGAAELSCAGLRLEVEPELGRRFPELADSVRAAFSARDDTDACPAVRLAFAESVIRVEVALADGRSTVRSLARPEDVIPTLQALVIVPEPSDAPSASKAAAAVEPAPKRARDTRRRSRARTAKRPTQRTDPLADRGLVPPAAEAFEPSAVRIELSTYLGAHAGHNGRSSLNFGVSTLLDIERFLAGLQLRIDQYQGTEEGRGDAFELAALVGRRFDTELVGVDLLLGPSAAFHSSSMTTDVAVPERRDAVATTSEENAVYACLAARGSLFPGSVLRPFVAADAALRLDESSAPVADTFPYWALGVTLGVTVGTL